MSSPNPTFVTAAAFAVAVLSVAGAFESYRVSAEYSNQFPDAFGAERSIERFRPLADRVPPSAKIGYLTDLDQSAPQFSNMFLAAQFALAPRALIRLGGQVPRPEWAVGNFSRPVDYGAAGEVQGYTLIADLGQGVVLFRRK